MAHPALINMDKADNVPIVWAIIYNVVSMAFGYGMTRLFKLPQWVTPAIAFNNTTSLPLLLVQSLDQAGILSSLLMSSSDTSSDAVARAKSYFLVNSIVGNSLTFAMGPKLLNSQNEDAPDEKEPEEDDADDANGHAEDQEHGDVTEEEQQAHEDTSLLPNTVARKQNRASRHASNRATRFFNSLPPWLRSTLSFLNQFLNPPLIGAVIGAIIGLAPPLHKAFFADSTEGGIFSAWLTSSIKNIGDLFAVLQIIVVGVKLSQAMLRLKKGEQSGRLPWTSLIFVTFVRFILWPAISIPAIYAIVKYTNILADDPVLWFAMMLAPVGPPALKLTALAEVNGSEEDEKLAIAKFLTISYALSPLIAFSVVGSLNAAEAAK